MSGKPVWRALYDRVSADVSPRMSDAMASDGVADAVEVAGAIGSRAAEGLQRTSERLLHTWNLPAGSDITVLRQEVGALTRELRALARQVDALQHELAAAKSDESPERGRAG